MLGALAFSSLIFKRYREKPRRPWMLFIRDTSKQAIGALLAHGLNILFSELLTTGNQNACVWYLANILVESILGLLMAILFFKLLEYFVFKYNWESLKSGYYGNPPKVSYWILQLVTWCSIVLVSKTILLFAVVVPLRDEVYAMGTYLLKPFEFSAKLELTMVMVIVPVVINTFMFWVTDDYLMQPAQERPAEAVEQNTNKQLDSGAGERASAADSHQSNTSYTDDLGTVHKPVPQPVPAEAAPPENSKAC